MQKFILFILVIFSISLFSQNKVTLSGQVAQLENKAMPEAATVYWF